MSTELEKFNARLDEEIKKLMGPDFGGTLDYENGLVVKYNGIEERNIDTPGTVSYTHLTLPTTPYV